MQVHCRTFRVEGNPTQARIDEVALFWPKHFLTERALAPPELLKRATSHRFLFGCVSSSHTYQGHGTIRRAVRSKFLREPVFFLRYLCRVPQKAIERKEPQKDEVQHNSSRPCPPRRRSTLRFQYAEAFYASVGDASNDRRGNT